MFLGVLIAYAIRSFISARLEQPKTNLTDRKHKMSLFFMYRTIPEPTLRGSSNHQKTIQKLDFSKNPVVWKEFVFI